MSQNTLPNGRISLAAAAEMLKVSEHRVREFARRDPSFPQRQYHGPLKRIGFDRIALDSWIADRLARFEKLKRERRVRAAAASLRWIRARRARLAAAKAQPLKGWVPLRAAAALLGIGEWQVRRLAKQDPTFPARHMHCGRLYFDKAAVEAWLLATAEGADA